jgi:hypothetical protein
MLLDRRVRWLRAALCAAPALAAGCDRGPVVHRLPDIVVDAGAWDQRAPANWSRGLPGVRWVQRLDTPKLVVRADAAGNVVLAASLEGPAEIGGRKVRPALEPGQDLLVASLDRKGAARWATVLGSEKLDNVTDLAVDARGFATVTGSYGAPLTLGGAPLALDPRNGPFSTYVARLDAAGVAVAGRGPEAPVDHALAAAEDGAVMAWGTAQVDVEVLDEKLARRWRVRCARVEDRRAAAVAFAGGGVILAGDSTPAAGIGCVVPADPPAPAIKGAKAAKPAKDPPPTTGATGSTVFVARFLDGGKVAWIRGVAADGAFAGLAAAPDGRFAVGVNAPDHVRVLLLDAEGKESAAAILRPEPRGTVRLAALALDAKGGVALAADFEGALDVAGTRLVALGRDVLVAQLAPDGSLVWARRLGDEQSQRAEGVSFDAAGSVVVVGREAIRQGGDRSAEDWFVMALSP